MKTFRPRSEGSQKETGADRGIVAQEVGELRVLEVRIGIGGRQLDLSFEQEALVQLPQEDRAESRIEGGILAATLRESRESESCQQEFGRPEFHCVEFQTELGHLLFEI